MGCFLRIILLLHHTQQLVAYKVCMQLGWWTYAAAINDPNQRTKTISLKTLKCSVNVIKTLGLGDFSKWVCQHERPLSYTRRYLVCCRSKNIDYSSFKFAWTACVSAHRTHLQNGTGWCYCVRLHYFSVKFNSCTFWTVLPSICVFLGSY